MSVSLLEVFREGGRLIDAALRRQPGVDVTPKILASVITVPAAAGAVGYSRPEDLTNYGDDYFFIQQIIAFVEGTTCRFRVLDRQTRGPLERTIVGSQLALPSTLISPIAGNFYAPSGIAGPFGGLYVLPPNGGVDVEAISDGVSVVASVGLIGFRRPAC